MKISTFRTTADGSGHAMIVLSSAQGLTPYKVIGSALAGCDASMRRRETNLDFELRDLKWAITASQHRSLSQAAEALQVRQSTLSRKLGDIERRLGSVLFHRSNGGTRPTAAGVEFLKIA